MHELELKQLSSAGIRCSQQRLFILSYLNEHMNEHLTVDDIYQDLKGIYPALVVATVYNTMNLFKEKGFVTAIEYPGEELRYDRRIEVHEHFKCEECGKIYDLPMESEKLKQAEYNGFLIKERFILLKGICPACRKEPKRQELSGN
ncbi:Fur family transcriptional regulator [Anaerocolumna aminovalerica]|uniref:Fur family transcriptional regulator, peroxide stress response regulator n=1 Tax=Anaerocolumna aminovalerica TaxID=1527 RepID=A0A1I5E113_9FIRM|nr:Fur family transcriptional regulator [Anaerocolumna aminovalerica]MBU5331102.1 transcriptional repressor [Anaerocolumna aminovalerica]SFO05107.1 Fur family transcriptional regulator, peroxide stress response regulator [Anaerocolumna aminovalerica]